MDDPYVWREPFHKRFAITISIAPDESVEVTGCFQCHWPDELQRVTNMLALLQPLFVNPPPSPERKP